MFNNKIVSSKERAFIVAFSQIRVNVLNSVFSAKRMLGNLFCISIACYFNLNKLLLNFPSRVWLKSMPLTASTLITMLKIVSAANNPITIPLLKSDKVGLCSTSLIRMLTLTTYILA